MKRFLLALSIASASVLQGCAVVDAYLMTKYDPNEYRIIAEIRTDAGIYKRECSNPDLSKSNAALLAEKTQLFSNYSEHIPRNTNVIKSSAELNNIAQGLVEMYKKPAPPSAVFCKIKFETIENSAKTMQHVIGARPR